MNIYNCWHQGNLGYGCRIREKRWLFVPEMGQPDKNIYKNLCLDDLIFKNLMDKRNETEREKALDQFTLTRLLQSILLPTTKPQTVGGQLFIVH